MANTIDLRSRMPDQVAAAVAPVVTRWMELEAAQPTQWSVYFRIQEGDMATCECGCGAATAGNFKPGHDQRLRAELERRVGGLLALRALVDAATAYASGQLTEQAFTQAARTLQASAARRVAHR